VLREFTGYPTSHAPYVRWRQDFIYGEGQVVAGESPQFAALGEPAVVYGGIRHYHLDHLRSVRMVTNAAGRSTARHNYDPFGVATTPMNQEHAFFAESQIDAMRFAGHQRDFQGWINAENRDYLDYMHARFYNPNWGRFLSIDPGKDWDMHQPQSWNMYAYVRNNPINATDPDGRVVVLGPKQNEQIVSVVKKAIHYEAVKQVVTSWRSSSGYERLLGATIIGIAAADVFDPGGKAKAGANAAENVVKAAITMDEAVARGAAHVGGDGVMEATGKGLNSQFRNTAVDAAGQAETKIGRFDVNPADPHVQKQGPHLNVETQVNGKVKKNEHIPIDPKTVRDADYPP